MTRYRGNDYSGNDSEDQDLGTMVKHLAGKYRKYLVTAALTTTALICLGMSYKPVGPTMEGVVTRLGRYNRTEQAGPHFIAPFLEHMTQVDVTSNNSVEIGFRTKVPASHSKPAQYDDATNSDTMKLESQMLTADENIAWVEVVIQYKVDPAKVTDYLFNVSDVPATIQEVGQAVTRQTVGNYGVDEILTFGRDEITQQIKLDAQGLLDKYGIGVNVVGVYLQNTTPPNETGTDESKGTVLAAFQNVETARQNMDQAINNAKAYQNKTITEATGAANQILAQAEADKATRIGQAQRDVGQFNLLLQQYILDPTGTERRLYLETMEKIYPNIHKVIMDGSLTDSNLLQLLNLNGGK